MYTKQEWNNGTKLDAFRLNHIEQGIYDCSVGVDKLLNTENKESLNEFASKESLQSIDEKFAKAVQELINALEKHKKEITALKTKVTKLSKKEDNK